MAPQAGKRTAVIERRWIGGSCANINCLPMIADVRSQQ
jgi:pyruvate/2-oxoglutarate dehydrogenase complex dihydrolipoamide dehydrogenase (E3) component